MLVLSSFKSVQDLCEKQTKRPFIKRYLQRREIEEDVQRCETKLTDAIRMFSVRHLPPHNLVRTTAKPHFTAKDPDQIVEEFS